MKKPVIIGVLVAIGVALLGYFVLFAGDDVPDPAPASETSQTQTIEADETGDTTPTAETEAITIANRAFAPETVTVKKGTKVTWTNQDSLQHDVTPDDETDEFQRSEMLSDGEIYSVTFNTPGTYTYHCTPHPDMTGTVVVTE